MKNNKIYMNLFIVSIILGILISIQFKSINNQNKGLTAFKRGEQLQLELKSLRVKEKQLQSEIEDIKKEIDKYKYNKNDNLQENIAKEIEKYEKLAGYTDVQGNGVEIKIESVDINSKNIAYNYDLILSIINKLNSAQANAISINNQRIVNSTYIELQEEGILINDTIIKEPFIIKVIGDKETLESAINIKYGIVWEIEKYYNTKVDVEKKNVVKVNGYRRKEDFKYSQLVN